MGFWTALADKLRGRSIDWEEVEETLILAELGVPLSLFLIKKLKARGWDLHLETLETALKEELLAVFPPEPPPLLPQPGRPCVVLLVGVNGSGKTTTAAKLGYRLKNQGHTVLLAAADTFRAAAIEQLCAWGERLGLDVIRGQYQGDPSALCYDAYRAALSRDRTFLLCDTAGRLHTKFNLMLELEKVARTLGKNGPGIPDEKWLVLDATTGMNGLAQARAFHATLRLTGVVLTKMDGSGRGGIAAAIQHELGITPRFLGTGEKPEDLEPFDRHRFVERLV